MKQNNKNKKLLGNRIKEIRKFKKISQEQLAEIAETSTNYLSRIERGTENPTLDMIIKIADALKIKIIELFNYEHLSNSKEIKQSIQNFIKTADDFSLRKTLKIINSIMK